MNGRRTEVQSVVWCRSDAVDGRTGVNADAPKVENSPQEGPSLS